MSRNVSHFATRRTRCSGMVLHNNDTIDFFPSKRRGKIREFTPASSETCGEIQKARQISAVLGLGWNSIIQLAQSSHSLGRVCVLATERTRIERAAHRQVTRHKAAFFPEARADSRKDFYGDLYTCTAASSVSPNKGNSAMFTLQTRPPCSVSTYLLAVVVVSIALRSSRRDLYPSPPQPSPPSSSSSSFGPQQHRTSEG